MIELSCHCGGVRFQVETPPAAVNECTCSLCAKYGALWSYYPPAQVGFADGSATETYVWGKRRLEFHRCATCGCVTHWIAVAVDWSEMGVNMRLAPPEAIEAAVRLKNNEPVD